jgi:hypothetical protein
MKEISGVASFRLEFRVHAALEPPKGGTPNYKMKFSLPMLAGPQSCNTRWKAGA